MRSDAFNRWPAFSLTDNFGLKQLSTTIKTFHYYNTGVLGHFKVIKTTCMCFYTFLSYESLFMLLSLTSLYF